jgi:plasmid stabilization system protein ParE
MARLLAWSPEAVEDLEAIAAYIERDSVWYANAVVSKIVETAESIPRFPELGRVVPEIGVYAIRERFVHSYRILYRIEDDRILVATIVHASRLLQPLLSRDQKPGTE